MVIYLSNLIRLLAGIKVKEGINRVKTRRIVCGWFSISDINACYLSVELRL